jgi:uncharacterized membrane protein
MVLASLRRALLAGLLLASLTWLACSPDSDLTGPTSAGVPHSAATAGETYSWTTESGVTVTMQTLGALTEGGYSQAFGIDDNNDVIVGYAAAPAPVYAAAFYWTPADGMQMIEADGWTSTKAYDVRDDIIVGAGYFNGIQAAFRRVGTEMQPLSLSDDQAIAEVVWEDGTAFGERRTGSVWTAVRWSPGSSEDYATFGDGINIRDANDLGDVVGEVFPPKAFVWRWYPNHTYPANQIELEPLDPTVDGLASIDGQAEGVNEQTQVVGFMWGPSPNRAFIWDLVSGTAELDGLADGYSTKAFDINDDELIVGESELPDGNGHAVVWVNRHPVDLHPPDGVTANLEVSTAKAVNNNGLIAGIVWTESNFSSAVVWTIEGDVRDDDPSTPEEQLALLKDEIADLAAAGVLNAFQAWSMTRRVNVALRSIEAGWTRWAIFNLRLLVWQINALVDRGRLTPSQAEPLLELAQGAIDGLRGD